MDLGEIKQLAENSFDDLMNDFWDSANIIAQDNLPNDLQKEEFYNNLSILLSNYK